MKTIGPFWRYYGGKWRAAPRYPAPERPIIVEPFAGAAGYSCRYHWKKIVLIDKSPIIAGIWDYLIHVTPAELLAIPDIPEGGSVDDLPVPQEARWLAGFWCNDGAVTPRKRPSVWNRKGGEVEPKPLAGWRSAARQRLSHDIRYIRHWTVKCGEYHEVEDLDATWMIDPPYQQPPGRYYKEQAGDYAALGEWTLRRKGQIIACDQEGATWLPWNRKVVVQSNPVKGAGMNQEVYYYRPGDRGLFP